MQRTAPQLSPILARVVSGAHGTRTPVREPLLRIIKVQGISMTAGPRENPDDDTEPREGETLYAYRIFLTDDTYIVGAVVDPVLHPLVHDRVLMTGACVRLTDYDVKTSVKKFANGKFTRYLKVRDLIVEHSPSIRFVDGAEDAANSGTAQISQRWRREEEEGEGIDEMVVIKQEAASSQPQPQADMDMRVDGTRDRTCKRDPDEHEYGLDDDDDDADFLQLDGTTASGSYATTPDSFIAADERLLPPDYTRDELDDFTEEELAEWFIDPNRVEPKTFLTEEFIAATWRNSQKARVSEQKLQLPRTTGLPSTKENSKPTKYKTVSAELPASSRLKRPASQEANSDCSLPPGSFKIPKPTPLVNSPSPQKSSVPPLFPQVKRHEGVYPAASKLTKLGNLLKKPLGSKVDVLAIIAACGEHTIKRSIGVKRDLHLLDPTVKRTVWLSVWVDADKFKPAMGTCVLFRGLTVHRFDGRSLNAFKELTDTNWYVIEPREEAVAGVDELKEWWRQRVIEEALQSFEEDLENGDDTDGL
ncbi:hypothetical protein DRE_06542 [Drechslerella stenobrocha 248]|uniref:Replication protein A OB domain-containing protein n=1 Tax=Drechslerella stenobrocha 248 TaxID=1043628 RepID=W7HNP2_9PEZI|nr:hypothetical protein DRE_06542 [Drechslerella stenobrocha 248]